jgi:phosphoesterase RecJ-like protein
VQILLDGILSDNGYYKHIRTDKYMSLIFTYLLISKGANPKETYDKMYVNNNINEIKLLGKLLDRIESLKDGQIIYTYQTDNDENEANAAVSSALLFQQLTSIKSGKIFLYFKVNTAENKVIISMRCAPNYDIGCICNAFGGGGHKVAAGATISGDYETVKKEVLNKILEVYFS